MRHSLICPVLSTYVATCAHVACAAPAKKRKKPPALAGVSKGPPSLSLSSLKERKRGKCRDEGGRRGETLRRGRKIGRKEII